MVMQAILFPMNNRPLARLVLAALCLTSSSVEAQQPNVVVILTDDQGYADISLNPRHKREVAPPHMDAPVPRHLRARRPVVLRPPSP